MGPASHIFLCIFAVILCIDFSTSEVLLWKSKAHQAIQDQPSGNIVPHFQWRGNFGKTVSHIINTSKATACTESSLKSSGECYEWEDKLRLKVTETVNIKEKVNCTIIIWEAVDCVIESLEDCFDLTQAHWYGGTVVKEMHWPIELLSESYQPYVTSDSVSSPLKYGGIQERYWVSSNGMALLVDWEVPLWVRINATGDEQLCFKGQYRNSPYRNDLNKPVWLKYKVCQGSDIRQVHDYMMANYIPKPTDIPDERLFRYPIWSTWVQYKKNINQTKVLDFAAAIAANGFSNSQLEIDDKWEHVYGNLEFDTAKFPDPKGMVERLSSLGYRTTLWVHPFVSLDSSMMREGLQQRYFVTDPGLKQPAFTSWWDDSSAMIIDFSSDRSKQWFLKRLNNLRSKYNINSFKFDAGETNWLPECYRLHGDEANPSVYSTRYAHMAYEADSDIRCQEVRVGAQTQNLPIFVRMLDKDSRWGYDNGIETIIPHALNVGIIGYPFVLPDMVGGNAYGTLPDRELFIRWAELNVFLPSVQFSIVPWQFDAEVVEITRNMSRLHESHAQTFIDLARESTVSGAPIIRPLWWIAPTDPEALKIDSEFLVGNDILVAPIVKAKSRSRDIYLPEGIWKDELRGGIYNITTVGFWFRNYTVELSELSYFTRASAI